MSVHGGDVRVPEQPLEDEHSQTQGIAVALQRNQLPVDRLRISNNVFSLDREEAYTAWNGKCWKT